MIIDFRYHVVTIVAVFLALGIGIIIGTNLGKTINSQLEKQIGLLEQTYERIRDDQKLLKSSLQIKEDELEIANKFQKSIFKNLIVNRLTGKRVGIIRTNESVDIKYAKDLTDILHLAGADIATGISFGKAINFNDPQLQKELLNSFGLPNTDKNAAAQIYSRIIEAIIQGNGDSTLQILQSKELIQLWGDSNQGSLDILIFLGGGMTTDSNRQKEIDLPLLEAARKTAVSVIGVEPGFISESYMRLYQSKCQSTIDNIDTIPGQVALVYLLTSGKKGNYGIKDTARDLIPTL